MPDENLIDKYEILATLGKGEYGIVYKAIHQVTWNIVAIKIIELSNFKEGIPSSTIREISLLKNISHPNVIKLLSVIYL